MVLKFIWYDTDGPVTSPYSGLQLSCMAEVVTPDDTYYRFMRTLRMLVGTRLIHLGKADYVCAYRFYVCEVKEKRVASRTGFVPGQR